MGVEEKIAKVLSLFDDEDIPYIKANIFKNSSFANNSKNELIKKKLGDKNDKYRK